MPDESEVRLCRNVKLSEPDSSNTNDYTVLTASTSDVTLVSMAYLLKPNHYRMLPLAMCGETKLTIGEQVCYEGKPVIAITRLQQCVRKCETTEGCLEKNYTPNQDTH